MAMDSGYMCTPGLWGCRVAKFRHSCRFLGLFVPWLSCGKGASDVDMLKTLPALVILLKGW